MRSTWRIALAACLVAAVSQAARATAGAVVERPRPGLAADRAGLLPGDLLLSWHREATPPSNPAPARGLIESPMDLRLVELEQAPRGAVYLSGQREGRDFTVEMPPGEWRLTARPVLAEESLAVYLDGRRLLETDSDVGLELWRGLASELERSGELLAAAWMWAEVAIQVADGESPERGQEILSQAVRLADLTGSVVPGAILRKRFSGGLYSADGPNRALVLQREILQELNREATAPEGSDGVAGSGSGGVSLLRAETLRSVAELSRYLGKWKDAGPAAREALAIAEREAPASLAVASVLNTQAIVFLSSGDWPSGKECLRRALEILSDAAPLSLEMTRALAHASTSSMVAGDLEAADSYLDRLFTTGHLVEEEGPAPAVLMSQAALRAGYRGDLMRAESFARRAHELRLEASPRGLESAAGLILLAEIAIRRGKLEQATKLLDEVMDICAMSPCGGSVSTAFASYALLAARRGDRTSAQAAHARAVERLEAEAPSTLRRLGTAQTLGRARELLGDTAGAVAQYREALRIAETAVPGSLAEGESLRLLGEARLAEGRPDEAEVLLRRALKIYDQIAPGTLWEASAALGVGRILRARGLGEEALAHFERAVRSIEAQGKRLGGDYEVRIRFAARETALHREHADLLFELGRPRKAFAVIERGRSRELAILLALRDVLAGPDLPAEERAELRRADRAYDQALAKLASIGDSTLPYSRRKTLRGLEEARSRWEEARSRAHAVSPRLAALEDPNPLDLERAWTALEPGTLALVYAVGATRTHLFALGPAPGEFTAVTIPMREVDLRRRVERFRSAFEPMAPDGAADTLGRPLTELLLAPVALQIARAERILLAPDPILYGLPFAALRDPNPPEGARYLIERAPLFFAPSLTAFADLLGRRSEASTGRVVAFGSPVYPPEPRGALADPVLGQAMLDGLRLVPLPHSRDEVESLATLFPDRAEIFLGPEATEEQAKSIATGAAIVHFASHGLLDEEHPMESALALTIPSANRADSENGLLQAWEIFEQVRLDTGLVTLSACDTARGGELAGAATIGLTSAFHYAGARSVLSTLWAAADRSSAQLMLRFYSELRGGASKAEALRRAQLALAADGGADHRYANPFYWAGYQLSGDWR